MTQLRNRTVLITGATGFVGSRLAKQLVEVGCEVHIITRPDSGLGQIMEILDNVTVYRHDGTMASMSRIMNESNPEIVFHLASLFISEHRSEDVIPLIDSNLLFGTQLLEAMKSAAVERLVNTGTSWQHYQNDVYNPVNLYAATKQAFEDILKYYQETADLQVITLKLYDTYGADDPRPKLMHLLKHIADTGEKLAMSPGEQMIDLVHIDDVTDAFLLAGDRLLEGWGGNASYAVSSGQPLSVKELACLMGTVLKKDLNIEWGGRPYRGREVMMPWDKGKILPGWRPRKKLVDGIRGLYESRNVN